MRRGHATQKTGPASLSGGYGQAFLPVSDGLFFLLSPLFPANHVLIGQRLPIKSLPFSRLFLKMIKFVKERSQEACSILCVGTLNPG
jgi:hypothetical protein